MQLRDAFRSALSWLALPALAVLLLQAGGLARAVPWPRFLETELPLLHEPAIVSLALVVVGGSLALWVDALLRRREQAVSRRDTAYGRRRRYTQAAEPLPPPAGPSRDVGLEEALAYIAFRSWEPGPGELSGLGAEAQPERLGQLLEALCDGSLTLWGRRRDDGRVEAVTSAAWRRLRDALPAGQAPSLARFRSGETGERYDHLLASRKELERRWPAYQAGNGLVFGEPRVARREDFHGRPVLVRCLLPVANRGATRLQGCSVVAVSLGGPEGERPLGSELSSRPRASGSAYAGAWASRFTLASGDRREVLITERVIEKRARGAPHQLKLAEGELPLEPAGSYLLTLSARGDRGEPVRVRLRVTIDAEQELAAQLA